MYSFTIEEAQWADVSPLLKRFMLMAQQRVYLPKSIYGNDKTMSNYEHWESQDDRF